MVGPGIVPAAVARFVANTDSGGAPRSRALVTPACNSCNAAAVLAQATGSAADIARAKDLHAQTLARWKNDNFGGNEYRWVDFAGALKLVSPRVEPVLEWARGMMDGSVSSSD